MKTKQLFLCAVTIMVCCGLWSCKKSDTADDEMTESETEEVQLTAEELMALGCYFNGTAISNAEIMEEAADIAAFLDKNFDPATKSASRSVLSLSPVTDISSYTKSGLVDTLAFVASFGEGLGYAVLSADRRADPVLAICPEGDLVDSVDSEAPDVASFLEGIRRVVLSQVQEVKSKQDNLLPVALAKIEQSVDAPDPITKASSCRTITEYSYGEWETELQIEPLVKVKWGQCEPYNLETPVKGGVHCPTGCGATAIAQIMAYCEYPENYDWPLLTANEKIYNWESEACNEVSRLMRNIGNGVNMHYRKDYSYTLINDVKKYLSAIGYDASEPENYSYDRIEKSIRCYYPVFIYGASSDDLFALHYWVIDGILIMNRKVEVKTTTIYTGVETATKARASMRGEAKYSTVVKYHNYSETQRQVHCNWGWRGNFDGWFCDGVFRTDNGNYDKNLKCIYDIRESAHGCVGGGTIAPTK